MNRDRKGGCVWTRFAFPTWWHYDVLSALDYFRSAGVPYNERMAEAIQLVQSKRDGDGRWRLAVEFPGVMLSGSTMEAASQADGSRWVQCGF